MNTPKQAFEGNPALECVFKDKDSEAWFPDKVRAAKNFPNGYTKITRASVMNPTPKRKTNARKRSSTPSSP